MPDTKSEDRFFMMCEQEGNSGTSAIFTVGVSPFEETAARLTISTNHGIVDLDISKRNLDALIVELQKISSLAVEAENTTTP